MIYNKADILYHVADRSLNLVNFKGRNFRRKNVVSWDFPANLRKFNLQSI